MATLLRQEIHTDAAGTYTAYVYADGHTETNPPGRPMSREDMQRERISTVAAERAKQAISAARASDTQAEPQRRESAATAGGRLLFSPAREYAHAVSTLVVTATTPQSKGGQRDSLIAQVYTGVPPNVRSTVSADDLDPVEDASVVLPIPKWGR